MSEYEKAAETDIFRTGDTAPKILKQNLTPHTGCNLLYVVLLYYLCTASRLHASISKFREISAVLTQNAAENCCTNERVVLGMPG